MDMSVKPRGAGWEVYVTQNGKKFRQTLATREDATLLEAKWRHALSIGVEPLKTEVNQETGAASSCTLEYAMTKTYDKYWRNSKNETAVINLMNAVGAYWGRATPINHMTTPTIEAWVSEMRTDKANATINRHLAIIRKVLRWAYHNDKLTKLPHIETLTEVGTERVDYFTKEEEEAILAKFKEMGADYLHDYAVVSVDTGMRASEVLKYNPKLIPVKAVRKDGSKVHAVQVNVRKNGKPLVVPLTKRAECILRNRSFDVSIHDYKYRKQWDTVRAELKLLPKCWHTWRHTCAARLVQSGMDVARIQKWMGHSTIATTMKYVKLGADDLVQGVDLLEE
jgi:integrase